MTLSSRALGHLLATLSFPLLAAAPLPAAAQTNKAAPAAPSQSAAANGGVIPLPLNPVIPAGQRQCAARTPSGLGYTELRAAEGPKPSADATVLVNYIGYLAATGAVFDQSMQSPMPVGEVIPGFSQGLQMIGRGGILRICIPAALGYGAQASGPIPANSDLVFQVELLDFKTAAEIDEMRRAQMSAPAQPAPSQP
ncbi:FKBP-type peptidyl-prolyl cis-trans isomerase [Sphingomonas sp. GM_Shp_1]|uniref:FKBP-type peptidyl-prolyl cis-trans isomerase n=1 Tax=Sphingomonas sp. GM_Shp_1 TaxID=2937381 RepID=UPI00226B3F8F|nr:FKBP-type peptidyl-prolyl cis-trans isomerase [Sphingomonas sp. GM_Shp_1]